MPPPIGHRLHFVGIAGTGMNAVAQLALLRGHSVSGSDRFHDRGGDHPVARQLAAMGARLVPQDGSGIGADTDAVVVSSAIETNNPDLVAAHAIGRRVIHRADALAAMLTGGQLIGVAGTSGKSTVTAMLGWIFAELGLDPTIINGAALIDWRCAERIGNVRTGNGPWQIAELDESDRSFLRFEPDWAIITNLSGDHFDIDETRRLFAAFRRQVRVGAVGAVDPDDVPTDLAVTTGTDGTVFKFAGQPVRLRLPGAHNAANAWQVLALCRRLDLDIPAAIKALERFSGIERRLERIADAGGITIYDDFAHNPAKIAAAITAVRPAQGRLHAIWQPHGFGPLRQMFDALTGLFAEHLRPADRLWLLPVYYAGGTTQRTVSSDDLAHALRERGVHAATAADWTAIAAAIRQTGPHAGDVILAMGARDPLFPAAARNLAAAISPSNGILGEALAKPRIGWRTQ